jgi:hypothetical protein
MDWAHLEDLTEGKKKKKREDKEENVSSYRMTLGEREDTGTWIRKYEFAPCEKDTWNRLWSRRKTGYLIYKQE